MKHNGISRDGCVFKFVRMSGQVFSWDQQPKEELHMVEGPSICKLERRVKSPLLRAASIAFPSISPQVGDDTVRSTHCSFFTTIRLHEHDLYPK